MFLKRLRAGPVEALQLFSLIRFGSLFLISILLSKSSLSVNEIGGYERFLFLSSLVSYFWINGLIQGLMPVFSDHTDQHPNPVFFNAAFLLFSLGFIAGAGLLLYGIFTPLMANSSGIIIWTLPLYTLLSAPAALIEYIYMLKGGSGKTVVYGIISFGFQVLIISVPVFAGMSSSWIFIGLLASAVFRVIWLGLLLRNFSTFRLSLSFQKKYIKLSYPLILTALIGGSTAYFDNALVNSFYSSEVFAIFRYGARELPLVVLLANSFSNGIIPLLRTNNSLEQSLETIKLKTLKLSHFLFPVTILLLVTSHWFFPLIFNPAFRDSASVFNIYLLIIIGRLLFPQSILIALKKTKPILINLSAAVGIHLVLASGFLYLFGITGLAFAAVLSNLSEKIMLVLSLRKHSGIELKQYLNIKWYLFYSILSLIAYFSSVN